MRAVVPEPAADAHGPRPSDDNPTVRPLPTLLIGALGGLLVGITSVGSGSVIMIALLMLYPGLSAVRLVGTDLVQAVPLVLAAALSNIALHGLDWSLLIPLVIGSVPGTILGARIAPRVPQSIVRRGIVIVLTMSGVALLDKAGWAPLGAGDDETHPVLIAVVGLVMLLLLPLVWGVMRRSTGLPFFGSPTLAQVEDPTYRPGGWRARANRGSPIWSGHPTARSSHRAALCWCGPAPSPILGSAGPRSPTTIPHPIG